MTSTRFALLLSLVLGLGGAAVACVDEASIDNDKTAGSLGTGSKDDDSEDPTDDDTVAEKDAGKPAVKDAGKDAGKPPVTEPDDEAASGDQTDPGDDDDKEPDNTAIDSGTPVETKPDAGTDPEMMTPPEPIMSVVPGSAPKANCAANSKAAGTMCGGYFCGVTQAQIEAEMPADTLCGESASEGACNNKLPQKVGDCAVDAISTNPTVAITMDFDSLRPTMRTCVNKDAELKEKTPPACLECFLDAAVCAGKNCLSACLTNANAKGCLDCRTKFKCDTAVFACANIISPL